MTHPWLVVVSVMAVYPTLAGKFVLFCLCRFELATLVMTWLGVVSVVCRFVNLLRVRHLLIDSGLTIFIWVNASCARVRTYGRLLIGFSVSGRLLGLVSSVGMLLGVMGLKLRWMLLILTLITGLS